MAPSERTFGPFGWKRASDDGSAGDGTPSGGTDANSEATERDDGTATSGPDRGEDGSPDDTERSEWFERRDENERIISERTLGPTSLQNVFGEESAPRNERTTSQGAVTGTGEVVDPGRTRQEHEREEAVEHETSTLTRVRRSFVLTAVLVGVGLIIVIDIMSMMIPILAAIGAGLVGGFVAGYIAGGTLRGAAHAFVAGVIGGTAAGFLTAVIGVTLGLYMEPASLVADRVGPISPAFSGMGLLEPLFITILIAAMIVLDATIAGGIGGALRSLVDEVR